jgi:hypothetical protein
MPTELVDHAPYALAVIIFCQITKDLFHASGSLAILIAILWALIFAFCDALLPPLVMKTVYSGITVGLMAAGGYSVISQTTKKQDAEPTPVRIEQDEPVSTREVAEEPAEPAPEQRQRGQGGPFAAP